MHLVLYINQLYHQHETTVGFRVSLCICSLSGWSSSLYKLSNKKYIFCNKRGCTRVINHSHQKKKILLCCVCAPPLFSFFVTNIAICVTNTSIISSNRHLNQQCLPRVKSDTSWKVCHVPFLLGASFHNIVAAGTFCWNNSSIQ